MQVKFYEQVEDHLLRFAVIVARHRGKWVFCKHWERDTYELPGGHREPGEGILEAEESGTIPEERIDASVRRILRAKLTMS